MELRESVRKIDLTGGRRLVRQVSMWMIGAFTALGALGYVMPVRGTSFCSSGGVFALAVFAVVGIAAVGLRNRHLGSGIITGVLATVGSLLALGSVLFAKAGAIELFMMGEAGLFFGGGVMVVLEPILYLLERRHRRETQWPRPLPVARALA
jgi:hypothetical protein